MSSDCARRGKAVMSLDHTGKGRKRWTMRWKAPLNAFRSPSKSA
ncbi:hypothetical protein [Nocardia sp. NPDC024068]